VIIFELNKQEMKNVVPVLLLLLYFLMNSSFISARGKRLITVKGIILSEKTGKPVSGALVYIVLGEEEALTKVKGEFSIETTKKLPLEVVTEHRDYKKQSVELSALTDNLVIRLAARQP
jgi:hypothetical protein